MFQYTFKCWFSLKAKAAEAKKICEDSGKQLVSLDSEEKHESICQHLKTSGKIFELEKKMLFHSGQTYIAQLTSLELDASEKFGWKTGRDTFIKWCPQQPVKGKGGCAAIVNCCVSVADCKKTSQFVCEEPTYCTQHAKCACVENYSTQFVPALYKMQQKIQKNIRKFN